MIGIAVRLTWWPWDEIGSPTCAIDVAFRQWVMRERGYHVHEAIWEASQRENSICADPFTVAAAFHSKRER